MPLDLQATFHQFADDFGEFTKVHPKLSRVADMHAMLLLEPYIFPNDTATGMVYTVHCCHVYLNIDLRRLARDITPETVRDLVRCGIFFDATSNQLCFVTRQWEERHGIAAVNSLIS